MTPLGRVIIQNGTVVGSDGSMLRGAPVWVYAWGERTGKSDYATDQRYFRRVKEAGLNAVRVVCFDAWQRANDYPHWDITVQAERDTFLSELDCIVDLAFENDLYVLINYHDSGNYDLPYLRAFWEWIAPRYAGQVNVFYELVNEPVQWSPSEYTAQIICDQQQLYLRVRELAPETHLVLLSFARIEALDPDYTAVKVASQLTEVDWSNASIGFHTYGCRSSKPIIALRAGFPVLNTETDVPAEAGGEENSTPLDGETYNVQTMERLAVSWFAWHVDGFENFEKRFVGGVLADARAKHYLWTPQTPVARVRTSHSAISRFFTEFPVRHVTSLMGMKRSHIALLVALSLAVALLDGTMLGMLIPISFGLFGGGFSFMSSWPGVPWLHAAWPVLVDSYYSMFLVLAVFTLLIGVVKNVLVYALHLATARLYGRYSAKFAAYLFGRYLTFGKAYFDHHNPQKVAAVIDQHHDLLNLFQGLLRLLAESMNLLAYLAVMLAISWRLTLVVLLVFPVVHGLRRWIAVKIRQPSERANTDSMKVAGQSFSVLAAIPLYQTFSREKSALDAYQANAEQLRKTSFRIWVYRGLTGPVQDVSALLALMIILSLAFVIEDTSTKQIAAMFLFFFVARLALPRLSAFHEVELDFEQKMPRARQIFQVFSDAGKHIVPGGKVELTALNSGIEFRHLAFAYPGNAPVLHDVSFSIVKGQMTALVGPSGAGKTTLTNLLLRFYDVPGGSLFIDGTDIREFSITSLRNQVALVNQDVILLNDSLRKNLQFGLEEEVSDEALSRVVNDAGLNDTLESLPGGLDAILGDRGLTLSGGQRQRVAIARALLRRAPILVLDEATSSLDSRTERHVQAAIENAVKSCTSLVIAHRLSTIQRADKVVVLDGGRVVEEGTLRELLDRRGLFHAMWETQKFD